MSTGPLFSSKPLPGQIPVGVFNTVAPAPGDGQGCALQLDLAGNLLVNIASGGGGVTPAVGTIGVNVPTSGIYIAADNPTGKLTGLAVDGSGNLLVNVAAGGSSGVQFADNAASGATPTGTLSMGWDSVGLKIRALKVDTSQNLLVDVSNATLAVTQSTPPWVVSGGLTHNNAAPTTNNVGVLPAVASVVNPVFIEGDQVLQSTDLAGMTRVVVGGVPVVVQTPAATFTTNTAATLTCAFASNVKKGTKLIAAVAVGQNSPPTVTDSLGNVWRQVNAQGATLQTTAIWAAESATAGACTVTLAPQSGSQSMAMQIYEVAGLAPNALVEASNVFTATSTNIDLNGAANNTMTPNTFMVTSLSVGTAAQTFTKTDTFGFQSCLTNISGQVNPTTPTGLFSFASCAGVLPTQQAISGHLGSIAGSELYTAVSACFKPYALSSGAISIIGQGAANSATNQVPVSITNGSSPNDGGSQLIGIVTPNGGIQPLAVANMVCTDGSNTKYGGLRTPNKFNTASVLATASGNTAVWTPAAGKKFRLMRFQITATNLAATAATVITISFQDNVTGMTIGTYDVLLPAAATATDILFGGTQFISDWTDLGNGFLSAAANNVLNANVSATVVGATGAFRYNVAGTEE